MAEAEKNEEFSEVGLDLEAAWDESDETEEVEEVVSEPITGDIEVVDEEVATEEVVEEVDSEIPEEVLETAENEDITTPPVGLSPEAREAWKTTPPAMQKAIAQREKQFAVGIQKYAEGAKRSEGMDKALQPFQQYLSMNGGPKHIGTLLQTGASLQMGSPVQKAQMISNLIQEYGVDIGTLDNMLVGKQPSQEVQEQTAVQQTLQQELAPMRQFMQQQQQYQQQQQQQQQGQVVSEVDAFSADQNNEFYNDVKMDMADLMDMSAKRGQHMSLQDAYSRACQINPQISTILSSRTNAQQLATKTAAASSIHGSPGGPGGSSGEKSIHDTMSAAWDNAGRA